MRLRHLALVALSGLLTLGAASGQHAAPPGGTGARLDGSTESTFTASVAKARRTLSKADRARFDQSMELAEHLFGDAATVRRSFNGAPVERVVQMGEMMLKKLDRNGDGKLDADELHAARGQLNSARMSANESAAQATLLNLASAQEQMRAMGTIDQDGDGHGEFAFIGEMAGNAGLRTSRGTPGDEHLQPPLLMPDRFQVSGSVVERTGYVFQVWLPGKDGAVAEAPRGGVGPAQPETEAAEHAWCAYAWPVKRGVTGNRVFFISQEHEVLASDNRSQRYNGRKRTPDAFAALPKGTRELGGKTGRGPRNDGGSWQRAR